MTDIVATIIPMITPGFVITLAIIYVVYRVVVEAIRGATEILKTGGGGEGLFKRVGKKLS